ncbi:MAG: FHA domain-containing protein [Gemmatimonadetes bacterium]|nr:FHA domain-containing protein [Gemmatimonadota bacterium]
MPILRLRNLKSGEAREFETSAVRIGRDPASELPITGELAKVVSSAHVRLVHDGAGWWVEDLGSRNGTYLDGKRLAAGSRERVTVGAVVGLGETGPRLKVEAVAQQLEATMLESPGGEVTMAEQPRMARPSEARAKASRPGVGSPPERSDPSRRRWRRDDIGSACRASPGSAIFGRTPRGGTPSTSPRRAKEGRPTSWESRRNRRSIS